MWVCVCVCTWLHVYMYVYVYSYEYVCACMHVHMCVHVCVCMCVYAYACVCVCEWVSGCMCMCLSLYIYIYIYEFPFAYICTELSAEPGLGRMKEHWSFFPVETGRCTETVKNPRLSWEYVPRGLGWHLTLVIIMLSPSFWTSNHCPRQSSLLLLAEVGPPLHSPFSIWRYKLLVSDLFYDPSQEVESPSCKVSSWCSVLTSPCGLQIESPLRAAWEASFSVPFPCTGESPRGTTNGCHLLSIHHVLGILLYRYFLLESSKSMG